MTTCNHDEIIKFPSMSSERDTYTRTKKKKLSEIKKSRQNPSVVSIHPSCLLRVYGRRGCVSIGGGDSCRT